MRRRWIAAALVVLLLWPALAMADPGDFDNLQVQRTELTGQLDVVKSAEATVLTDLFNLNRQLETITHQLRETQTSLDQVEVRLQATSAEADRLKLRYENELVLFGRRVRFMAEQGTVTYLAVLFNSNTLSDFIWRFSLIQLIIQRDAALLSSVRSLHTQVVATEADLQAQRQQLSTLSQQLITEQTSLQSTVQAKNDKLASLQDQRGHFEQSLDQLEKLWNDKALPVLKYFGQAFHNMATHVTDLKPSHLDFSFVPTPHAVVTVKTEDLNRLLQQFPDLKGLAFTLLPNEADVSGDFGGATLTIAGQFVIVGDTILRYQPQKVSFASLPIGDQYTQQLVAGGGLDLDLSSIVTHWKLTSAVVDTNKVTVKASYSP